MTCSELHVEIAKDDNVTAVDGDDNLPNRIHFIDTKILCLSELLSVLVFLIYCVVYYLVVIHAL